MHTHISPRLRQALQASISLLAGGLLGFHLGYGSGILPGSGSVFEGHFLQRQLIIQKNTTSSAASSSRGVNMIFLRRAVRLQQRLASGPLSVTIRRPVLITEPMHTAASSVMSRVEVAGRSADAFPAFGNAVSPVTEIPDWGSMKTSAEWNRSYDELSPGDFSPIPSYDLSVLTTPIRELLETRNDPETIRIITAKLFYSTRYFGAYDLDAGEFTAVHPGIDLKLAEGTPVGAVAGGRVHDIRRDDNSLGLHVIIEHRAPDGTVFYSVYGHLSATGLKKGDSVTAGQMIGTVGMTGNTSGPHLHLQIDRGEADEAYHTVYWPGSVPSRTDADRHAINPITFIRQY